MIDLYILQFHIGYIYHIVSLGAIYIKVIERYINSGIYN